MSEMLAGSAALIEKFRERGRSLAVHVVAECFSYDNAPYPNQVARNEVRAKNEITEIYSANGGKFSELQQQYGLFAHGDGARPVVRWVDLLQIEPPTPRTEYTGLQFGLVEQGAHSKEILFRAVNESRSAVFGWLMVLRPPMVDLRGLTGAERTATDVAHEYGYVQSVSTALTELDSFLASQLRPIQTPED